MSKYAMKTEENKNELLSKSDQFLTVKDEDRSPVRSRSDRRQVGQIEDRSRSDKTGDVIS